MINATDSPFTFIKKTLIALLVIGVFCGWFYFQSEKYRVDPESHRHGCPQGGCICYCYLNYGLALIPVWMFLTAGVIRLIHSLYKFILLYFMKITIRRSMLRHFFRPFFACLFLPFFEVLQNPSSLKNFSGLFLRFFRGGGSSQGFELDKMILGLLIAGLPGFLAFWDEYYELIIKRPPPKKCTSGNFLWRFLVNE